MATFESARRISRVAQEQFVRFSLSQRIEHLMTMISFSVLAITGIPQKYHDASWAQWIIINLGGIDSTRFIHRFFAYLFAISAIYHLGYVSYRVLLRRARPTMIPTLKDARDAVTMLRYSLGIGAEPPKFDRFDYRQKFEYWGLVFGGIIMGFTGVVLMYPMWVTQLLPGQVVAAAKEFHTNEALLALLTITIWHLYGAHFGPGRFPIDTSIFTGRISRKRMEEEHSLELERFEGGPDPSTPSEIPSERNS